MLGTLLCGPENVADWTLERLLLFKEWWLKESLMMNIKFSGNYFYHFGLMYEDLIYFFNYSNKYVAKFHKYVLPTAIKIYNLVLRRKHLFHFNSLLAFTELIMADVTNQQSLHFNVITNKTQTTKD